MQAEFFDRLLKEQKIAYAITDAAFQVVEHGGESGLFPPQSGVSLDLFEVLPELLGSEEILRDVLESRLPDFQLENLNRVGQAGETLYLSLTLLPYCPPSQADPPRLLIILHDTTAWTGIQQTLTQQRNELRLLQHSLAQTNQQLEFILQYYVPREVSKGIMEKRIVPELGGELREITVLFADLRNYTATSERLTPKQTVEMLHVYLDLASSAVAAAGGVIVNYMGDALMAVFNAPEEQPDHARLAIRAGLDMQARAAAYRKTQAQEVPPMYFGVGINTGQVLVGNIGAHWHYQYTAVGDSVNVASRICSYARPGEVLIGPATQAMAECLEAEPLAPLKFKGKSQEIMVYRVPERA